MQLRSVSLEGVKVISPKKFCDPRGFFRETYRQNLFAEQGITCDFVQDNHSYSKYATIRGMHFQGGSGQAKLISVAHGKIYDVVVDIRLDSPTFGKWEGIYLDAHQGDLLFIPVGFAHGFAVVSEEAHVIYKVSNYYDPSQERGFRYDDPTVNIAWPIQKPHLSDRDLHHPLFKEVVK